MAYIGNVSGFDTVGTEQIKDGAVSADKVAADVATQAELDVVSTVADAALPKAGGAITGAVTTNSTFDGVDIATRDTILTSTTTTAGAALPKAGGAMTGAITTNSTFDGRDVATDGTKLDTLAIGTTVQAYDADTTKNDVANTFTATQTLPAIKLTTGAGASKVLTSDANGDASWAAPAGGGATDIDGLSDGYNDGSSVGLGTGALANDDGTTNLNTAVGTNALAAITSGYGNTAFGHHALQDNTMSNNTAIGAYALTDNTTGQGNAAHGYIALYKNTTGRDNTASGYFSLVNNTTGSSNTAHGAYALRSNTTGANNTAQGYKTLFNNTTGGQNISVGAYSLYINTSGHSNTASGYQTLYSNTVGASNAAHGYASLYANTTGTNNTASGRYALFNNTTGNYNTGIGNNARSSSATVSGEFTLGDSNVSNLRCNDTSISSLSDQRDKTEVVDSPYGLAFINTVQPRQFKWATRDGNVKDGSTRVGFIAQELLTACDGENAILDLVMDNNPDKIEAKYGNLLPIAVQAIKELSIRNDALEARLLVLETTT